MFFHGLAFVFSFVIISVVSCWLLPVSRRVLWWFLSTFVVPEKGYTSQNLEPCLLFEFCPFQQ